MAGIVSGRRGRTASGLAGRSRRSAPYAVVGDHDSAGWRQTQVDGTGIAYHRWFAGCRHRPQPVCPQGWKHAGPAGATGRASTLCPTRTSAPHSIFFSIFSCRVSAPVVVVRARRSARSAPAPSIVRHSSPLRDSWPRRSGGGHHRTALPALFTTVRAGSFCWGSRRRGGWMRWGRLRRRLPARCSRPEPGRHIPVRSSSCRCRRAGPRFGGVVSTMCAGSVTVRQGRCAGPVCRYGWPRCCGRSGRWLIRQASPWRSARPISAVRSSCVTVSGRWAGAVSSAVRRGETAPGSACRRWRCSSSSMML